MTEGCIELPVKAELEVGHSPGPASASPTQIRGPDFWVQARELRRGYWRRSFWERCKDKSVDPL